MHRPEDFALLVSDPIRERGKTIMQAPPEINPVGRRGRNDDRTQPCDMFMAHLATLAASLNQAHLQSVGSLAEAHEHGVVASFWRSYVLARNRATTRSVDGILFSETLAAEGAIVFV